MMVPVTQEGEGLKQMCWKSWPSCFLPGFSQELILLRNEPGRLQTWKYQTRKFLRDTLGSETNKHVNRYTWANLLYINKQNKTYVHKYKCERIQKVWRDTPRICSHIIVFQDLVLGLFCSLNSLPGWFDPILWL